MQTEPGKFVRNIRLRSLYAVDDTTRVDKNRAQFEGSHATLAKHRQRRPQRDARRREPTDAAA